MNALIPLWIIGGPIAALLILSFSFNGPSAMGGLSPRLPPRSRDLPVDPSVSLVDPVHPDSTRRFD